MDQIMYFLDRTPKSVQMAVFLVMTYLVYSYITRERKIPGLPVATVELTGWQRLLPNAFRWMAHGREIVTKGLEKFPSCFQICTMTGYKVIVPSRFSEELTQNHHSSLTLNGAFKRDFFVDYPGFEGHRQGLKDETLFPELVRVKLTQSLNMVNADLVDEANDALQRIFGEDCEWQKHPLKDDILNVVARLSSRVFLGPDLCRNEEWLAIAKNYTTHSFAGSLQLRMFPAFLQPIVHWFLPTLISLRKQVKNSNKLILPEVERRRKQAEDTIAAGEKMPKIADAIGWMVEIGRGREVDYVSGQLALSMVAIHTTTEALTTSIVQLCDAPEMIQPLRDEVLGVLRTEGWSKNSLHKMRLLDSFMKEVQRFRTISKATLNRHVEQTITLSDGTILPTGTRLMVSTDRSHNASIYEEPTKFDMYRFYRSREAPGEENRHQFASASVDHLGFGLGPHSCPGRFFASDQLKIALSFMLVQYDFRYIPGVQRPKILEFEHMQITPPNLKIELRKRQDEIDILAPKVKKVDV